MSDVVLLVAGLVAVVVFVLLHRWSKRHRAALGVGDGVIVAGDDSNVLSAPDLFSARLGLVGRPDQLLRVGRHLIPVEQKPNARRLRDSHVMQLAVQCLLVQERFGRRPPYGIVVLAGGAQEKVPFTPALEQRLFETVEEMRGWLRRREEPGAEWVAAKCRSCGFRRTCWD
jgi:CRISPR-associated exonuclease Cas4